MNIGRGNILHTDQRSIVELPLAEILFGGEAREITTVVYLPANFATLYDVALPLTVKHSIAEFGVCT
ncbi:hypothetical protein INT44_004832 [Umbelopsis vinacea]|uniref:Uncharacterized protein n=1 Tax=Umbelopsis vinacea TaxID=44442 RepID=A0A8H7UMG9_9FUNG|nr:hypothetical protein INT44_004832 [Umbelopsis vinacea]